MLRLLFFPFWLLYEIGYLIRHPWSFNLTATLVWATITALGFAITQMGNWIALTPFVWMLAIAAYYYLKIKLNRRRPEVMKRFHEYYSSPAHIKRYRPFTKKGPGRPRTTRPSAEGEKRPRDY